MGLIPIGLSSEKLEASLLREDKKNCIKAGPVGIGARAMYLNSFYIDRMYYIPFTAIHRIYKRVAMSRGGFTGKGLFASMAYLVVEYDDGKEKQCNFKFEQMVDAVLEELSRQHPELPLYSEAGEKRLKAAEEAERARYLPQLSPDAEAAKESLKKAGRRLNQNPLLYQQLAKAARTVRMTRTTRPFYSQLALLVLLAGIASLAIGVLAFLRHMEFSIFFVLFGFAAIFLLIAARVRPTGAANRADAEAAWEKSIREMEASLPGNGFPVPPRYAHPITLERMIRILREGRAVTVEEALEVLKEDLRGMTSQVQVTQKDYDEVVVIKPLFLASDYC